MNIKNPRKFRGFLVFVLRYRRYFTLEVLRVVVQDFII